MPDRELRKKQITIRRQEQILKAALDVFAQKGFTAATIPEIARLAGVAAGTIYLYYPSKRDLFVAVIENLIVTPLEQIFKEESNYDFSATLKDALQNRIEFLQGGLLAHFLSLIGEIWRDSELRSLFLTRLMHPFMSRMEKYFPIHKGQGQQIDPAILVRLIAGMMVGLTVLKGLEGETSPLNRVSQEDAAEQIKHFILFGIIGREPDGERTNE